MEKYFYTKEITKICSVTRKTLRYYEDIGLLIPDYINEKDGRMYNEKSIAKLQEILLLKKMHFSLKEIKKIMNASYYNSISMIEVYKNYLLQRIEDFNTFIQSMNDTTNMHKNKIYTGILDKKFFSIFSYKRIVTSVTGNFFIDKNTVGKNREIKSKFQRIMEKCGSIYDNFLNKLEPIDNLYKTFDDLNTLLKLHMKNYTTEYFKTIGWGGSFENRYMKKMEQIYGYNFSKELYEEILSYGIKINKK